MKTLVVVSTFDGISVALLALRWRFPDYRIIYYSIEIDAKAMMISKYNHPDSDLLSIRYLGDIRLVTKDMIPEQVDIYLGGSPCTNLSIAGKRNGLMAPSFKEYMKLKKSNHKFEGQSYLFWEFIRLKKLFKPTYFMLENVRMKKEDENIITNALEK